MAGTQRTRAYHGKSAGAVSISEAEITFSAANARVLVDSLPAGAVILDAWIDLKVAFNAGTSNAVTMGWGAIDDATDNDIVETVDETTPAVYPGVVLASAPMAQLTTARDVYLYYKPGDAAASTGQARGYLVWARMAANG